MYALIERGGFVAEAEVTGLATALADALRPGRRSADRLTVCDLAGTGVQEIATPAGRAASD